MVGPHYVAGVDTWGTVVDDVDVDGQVQPPTQDKA